MRKLRNILLNLPLLFFTVLLFFGGMEVALRLTGLISMKPNPPRIYQTSSISNLGYELKSGISERAYRATVSTNSLGFRGPELDPEKLLIAVLGDSITFGYGVENDETIPARLQKLLPDFNVLNAASPGYNLIQQTAVYREKIAKLGPVALILIFHFNDLEEWGIAKLDGQGILRPEGWTSASEQCSPIRSGLLGFVPGKCWLDIHSAFYKAVKKFVTASQGKRDLAWDEESASTNAFSERVTEESLQKYRTELAKLAAMLPGDLPRLFVIWPERHLHFPAREQLESIVESQGFSVLDLYEVFGNSVETLPWDTVHPSAKTNTQAAEVIATALQHFDMIVPPAQ